MGSAIPLDASVMNFELDLANFELDPPVAPFGVGLLLKAVASSP